MFIHIGGDTMVRMRDVVAIFDKKTEETSQDTRAFLEGSDRLNKLVRTSSEPTKSYVITTDRVYCSPISVVTLKRRAAFFSGFARVR
ncbi:hypothetical protein BSNK01_23280 [Bacillaceae bacterium]